MELGGGGGGGTEREIHTDRYKEEGVSNRDIAHT